MSNYTSDYRAAEAGHLLSSNPELAANTERDISELDREILQAQDGYERIAQQQAESAIYQRFAAQWHSYHVIANQVLELSRTNQKDVGSALYMSSSRIAYAKASETLGELTSRTVMDASEASKLAAQTHDNARKLIIGAMAIAVLGMIGALQYINRRISRPLLDLAARMRSLAVNEMGLQIRGTRRRDEIGEMARAVVIFRNNAIELAHSQSGLIRQASMLKEKLQYEQRLTTLQRNFLAMASHEFRNPLTIIDGHAQRMNTMKAELQPHHIAERADKIRKAVLRMTNVMDNLLTSSRLFDGDPGLYFHPKPIDIGRILHEVCHLHREIWLGAQIVENFRYASPTIMGDPHLLFQAFSNLLSNAVKYSPNGGMISVKTAIKDGHVVITTQDNGIGIPAEDIERLFERYHRGSNVSGISGTGIGLYLVKMVVSLHDGQVLVASEVDKGTEFIVRLPLSMPH